MDYLQSRCFEFDQSLQPREVALGLLVALRHQASIYFDVLFNVVKRAKTNIQSLFEQTANVASLSYFESNKMILYMQRIGGQYCVFVTRIWYLLL